MKLSLSASTVLFCLILAGVSSCDICDEGTQMRAPVLAAVAAFPAGVASAER